MNTMFSAKIWEATVDILATSDRIESNWTAAGTWMTPHEQYGDILCFSSVVCFILESVATIGVRWVEFFFFIYL